MRFDSLRRYGPWTAWKDAVPGPGDRIRTTGDDGRPQLKATARNSSSFGIIPGSATLPRSVFRPRRAAACPRRPGDRPAARGAGAVTGEPHIAAEGVAETVRREIGAISLQSVYDALNLLVTGGVIRRIQPAGSPARFECRTGDNHHHLICRTCGRIVDVDCAVGAAPCLTAADDQGYEIDEAEVAYWGRCPPFTPWNSMAATATSNASRSACSSGSSPSRRPPPARTSTTCWTRWISFPRAEAARAERA